MMVLQKRQVICLQSGGRCCVALLALAQATVVASPVPGGSRHRLLKIHVATNRRRYVGVKFRNQGLLELRSCLGAVDY